MNIKTMKPISKTKKHGSEHNYELCCAPLHFSICIFSFLLLPVCVITEAAAGESPSGHIDQNNLTAEYSAPASPDASAAVPNQVTKSEPNQQGHLRANKLSVSGNKNSQLENQLRQDNLIAPASKKSSGNKDELKRLIQQIRSIEFKQQKGSEPAAVSELGPKTEPNKTSPQTETQKVERKKETETQPQYEPIAEQTLQTLKNLSQHPERAGSAFELAELLFLSSRPKEAAAFYQEALNRSSIGEAIAAEDRAWILFQIGNCLRNDDPPAATKAYKQLITEYPNSTWAEPAKNLQTLIDWYQKDKPQQLIAERKS